MELEASSSHSDPSLIELPVVNHVEKKSTQSEIPNSGPNGMLQVNLKQVQQAEGRSHNDKQPDPPQSD